MKLILKSVFPAPQPAAVPTKSNESFSGVFALGVIVGVILMGTVWLKVETDTTIKAREARSDSMKTVAAPALTTTEIANPPITTITRDPIPTRVPDYNPSQPNEPSLPAERAIPSEPTRPSKQ